MWGRRLNCVNGQRTLIEMRLFRVAEDERVVDRKPTALTAGLFEVARLAAKQAC
jgi:hypothetical protein